MEKTVQSCPNAGFNDTALKIEVAIDILDRGVVGKAVEEFKRAEARLDGIGRGDGRRDVCCNGSRLKV
jgi:hypothetical protein